MPDSTHPIAQLAQKCASNSLRLPQAVNLFTIFYLADAVALEGGNITKAASRAGISRGSLLRIIKTARGHTGQIGEKE